MSAPAVGLPDRRAPRFYDSTVGKKVVMAVSGVVLFGYVVAHLLGNLQIFIGPDQINHYAALLHASPPLLWTARTFLLVMLFLHIWSSFQLALRKWDARPEAYVKKRAVGSSYASRTMYWSGPIVFVFVVYHILHFTVGVGGTEYIELHPYENVVHGVPQSAGGRLLHRGHDSVVHAPVSRPLEHVPDAGRQSSALHAVVAAGRGGVCDADRHR